jgi:L-arabinose transport system substrate-binding protein
MRIVKSLAVILMCAFIATWFGCSKQTSDKITIGYIVKQPDQPWFQNEWKFAQQAADQYGFDLEKMGGEDGSKVVADIDRLGTMQAQGLIICTPDPRLGPSILARAAKYNMKVYSVDDQFQDADNHLMDEHHMGISARDIGHMVGQALWDEMQKRGWKPEETVAAIITHVDLETHRDRTDGAIESLTAAGFPPDRIYACPQKTVDIPGGRDAANIALVQHQDVKNWLTAGINDEAVLGAVRAMEDHGFTADHVIGIGIGGDTGVNDFQKPDPTGFFASVLISPKRHGFEATEFMYKWIHDGVEPPKVTLTTGILITRENYQQVRKDQGLD